MTERIKSHKLREWREQNTPSVCDILGIPLDDAVVDHDHQTGRIRGVIHRQANALLGKIENFHRTFLAKLGCSDLRTILNSMMDYIERDCSANPYHPSYKSLQIRRFKNMTAEQQRLCLKWITCEEPASNAKERVKQYAKTID